MEYDLKDEIVEKVFKIDPTRAESILKACQLNGIGDPVEIAQLFNSNKFLADMGLVQRSTDVRKITITKVMDRLQYLLEHMGDMEVRIVNYRSEFADSEIEDINSAIEFDGDYIRIGGEN